LKFYYKIQNKIRK